MKEIIRSPKQLHLPRTQFSEIGDYTTYPAHDADIIAKRRAHPGTLVADQELRGIAIFEALTPERFDTSAEQRAASEIREHTGIGSGHYGLTNDTTMYSVLRLGSVATGGRTHDSELHHFSPEEYQARMHKFAEIAGMLACTRLEVLRLGTDPDRARRLSRHVGRGLASAALYSRAHDMPGRFTHLHPVDVQLMVRDTSIELLDEVAERGREDGALPSVAQLAEPDSPVAVRIRRHAPTAVIRAYEQALTDNPELAA